MADAQDKAERDSFAHTTTEDIPMDHIDMDKITGTSSAATSIDHSSTDYRRRPDRPLSMTAGNRISLDDVDPVDIQIRDLAVTVDTSPSIRDPSTYPDLLKSIVTKTNNDGPHTPKTKTLLHSVSASLRPGTLTAILGGSGSGKTTLLNTVSERITSSPRLTKSGATLVNGTPSSTIHSVRHAYVMQQDVLLPTLTVRETLQYSADLRLPAGTSTADRARVVDEVILELGLKECADTRIGNSQHRGCSGGEKRRVSIGVQMLANPSVLFLDEPTTGLDATSAFQLVRTLKGLALKGRTVVITIHQPRSEIWDLFDGLVVLARGSPVYSGSVKECLPWFAGMGFEVPGFVNPAEFVIDIAAVDNRTPELEEESSARVKRLKEAWTEEAARVFGPAEKEGVGSVVKSLPIKTSTPFLRQLTVLTDRSFKVTIRDPMGMAAAIIEAVVMGVVTGYIFYNLSRDQAGIRSREGALYSAAALQGYLFLVFEVYRLTIDIPTFDREHSEGCSDPLPFLLSRRLSRMFTEDIPVPFLYSVIYYFMAGFDRDASKFFIFFSIVLLGQYIAVTCAMTCVVASRNFAGASLISNLVYTLQSVCCGYFIQSNAIPVYVRWLKYVAFAYYAVGGLFGNEFKNSFYDCPFEGGESNPECEPYTGAYVMDSLGFPRDWVAKPIIVLVAFVVFFYTLSWIGLTFMKVEMSISRARNSDADLSAGKEKMTARSIDAARTIDVGLVDFALGLDKRTATGKKLPSKTILNPVTATFQAGVLNVIMGPSGSGKTSLLNAMALRLDNGIGTRYRPSGKLLFNGAEPSNSVIRSVCSYVCQDDDALLPSLTVRETLRFAAGLRLPKWMTKDEKYKRAEEVLLKLGLKDCADNLIGNELVKGISGGEKRRVTIAVQILTDPRVLLLDEPTSGLDAFTASSIMEVLQGLAHEGRTLILTIHQARSDVFKHFGNVLLLARGGSPAYAGPARDMLAYFEQQGFECPRHTNPADFALDLITIDLQQEDREATTREKVRLLVSAWSASPTIKPTVLPSITEEPSSSQPKKSKSTLASPAELGALLRHPSPLTTSVPILLHRATLNLLRQPPLIMARIMQVVGFGGVLALFMAPLAHDVYSVQTRVGLLQQMGALYFVGMLQNVAVYPAERDVFYREQDDGVYGVGAFAFVYTLLEIPTEVLASLLFGLLGVLAIGLPRTAEMYFVACFVCFCLVSCGESLGIVFNTLFSSHTGFAVNVTSIFLSVAQILGGVMSIDMPRLFQIFNYLSPIRYAIRAFAPFSLESVVFTCNEAQMLPNGRCAIENGVEVLRLYKLDVDAVVNVAALAGCAVLYRLGAWVVVKVARTRWEVPWGKRK
ncbi:ABC transporter [Coniochaeta sp. 2T2.1]|nr:ABC transporter [Coniochaeta sp. 2T2.1]